MSNANTASPTKPDAAELAAMSDIDTSVKLCRLLDIPLVDCLSWQGMGMVLGKMRERGWVEIMHQGPSKCSALLSSPRLSQSPPQWVELDTLPRAVAVAAILALQSKGEQ